MASVLTINAGSSSSRLAGYRVADGHAELLARAHAEASDRPAADVLKDFIDDHRLGGVDLIGHRVVHGGTRLTESCWLTDEVEQEIGNLAALAPLHNPRAVTWIRACRSLFGPSIRQAAVFDTAFFARLPSVAKIYALPAELAATHGLQRFGFHGLAHQSMLRAWRDTNPQAGNGGRLITIQLGAGCSIAAIRGGRPVDTSMGFTPVEGLVMATRSGDVDPGLLVHLLQQGGLTAADLDRILNYESGLLGLSERSSDMRELLAADDAASTLAVAIYCYRTRKYIGAYLAALNGADAILFGGGVGENAPPVRERILSDLDGLGVVLDDAANAKTIGERRRISARDSPIAVWVAPVDEEAILIEEILGLLARGDDTEGRAR